MKEPVFNDDRLDAVFAQARNARVDTARAEYGFETRVMARVRDRGVSLWEKVSWRMIPGMAVGVAALALWAFQAAGEASDAQAVANVDNPETPQLWME